MKNYYILKTFCKRIFLVGTGNFWYENAEIGDDSSIYYRTLSSILFFAYCFMTLLEIMAAFMGDFPEDERRDSITLSVSHSILLIKIFSIIYNKKIIKQHMYDIVRVCEMYEKESLLKERYRFLKMNVLAYCITVYSSAAFFVLEGLKKSYSGSHFVTIITYYPSYNNDSGLATFIRICNTVILYIMLLSMIIVDGFAISNLIILKHKFVTLRHYFEDLREDVEKICEMGNYKIAGERLTNGVIEGIVMHKELLRLSNVIDKVFGTAMAFQLCQSSGAAVSLMLLFALSENLTLFASLRIISFVAALFLLLGLFLCNAGEITYQASLLPDAIFYCGWHLCPARYKGQNLGKIISIACAQAQQPLVMKAFKMFQLTYVTFLQVIRGTYSVFALIYAQNQ
ncbi:unnamed protein product [Pieris macdunnoughi]|uniref:Odorant receptor n=1 Tax=Pieris macdunnoughi TaxID=345717 RepID=A0A821QLV1_9NEOP|nr:unnamed protein product [Pieris macdunnoughi]